MMKENNSKHGQRRLGENEELAKCIWGNEVTNTRRVCVCGGSASQY